MGKYVNWQVVSDHCMVHPSGYRVVKHYGSDSVRYAAWSPADQPFSFESKTEPGRIEHRMYPRFLGKGSKDDAVALCQADFRRLKNKKGTPEPESVRVDKSRHRAS